MSRPLNILSTYRSYAYHHILVVCESSDVAASLAETDNIDPYMIETGPSGLREGTIGGGRYVVLINGMTDAQTYIVSAKWSIMTNLGTDHKAMSMMTSGEIDIHETGAVMFLTKILSACTYLGAEPQSLSYLIKTIFVGHKDQVDSDNSTTFITAIKPFLFYLTNITASVTQTGTDFVLTMQGINDGAAHIPANGAVAKGLTVTFTKGMSLEDALKHLEGVIKQQYTRSKEQVKCSLERNGVKIGFDEAFKDLEYVFTLSEHYKSGNYKVGTATVPEDGKGNFTITNDTKGDIYTLLQQLIMSSKEILDERKPVGPDNRKEVRTAVIGTTYKHGIDKDQIIYKIIDMTQVVVPSDNPSKGFAPAEDDPTLEFDYIYTGHNIDIIDFDMKLQFANSFLYSATTSLNAPVANHVVQGYIPQNVGAIGGTASVANEGNTFRGKRTFVPSMPIESANLRGNAFPMSAASYWNLLSRYAAMENMATRIVIHGNPVLLNDFCLLPKEAEASGDVRRGQSFTSGILSDSDGQQAASILQQRAGATYRDKPVFIKINVKFPAAGAGEENTTYENFWYQGYYYISTINNIFDNGLFKQELELFTILTDDGQASTSEQCNSDEDLTNTRQPTTSTSANSPTSNSAQGSSAVQRSSVSQGTSAPLSNAKAEANRNKSFNFWKSKGYTDEQAAAITGNFQQESSFNPTTFNEREGAYGIGQWRNDRLLNLQKFARQRGTSIDDIDTQLEFAHWEMNNTEKKAGAKFKNATSVEEATAVVDKFYERSSGHDLGKRTQYAQNALAAYGGTSTSNAQVAQQPTTAPASTQQTATPSPTQPTTAPAPTQEPVAIEGQTVAQVQADLLTATTFTLG
jgi:hypothetical protein